MASLCSGCGGVLPAGARFCPVCGAPTPPGAAGTDPLLGTVIGDRFRLLERIGAGGSGTIYRAEHVTLRRKAAVKILHAQLSADQLSLERFRREATTVAQIESDHLVEVSDFGTTADKRLFFAMELLEGETLAALLAREKRLAVERAVDILTQIAEGLMEAHAMGYVHRDLRPANIFLVNRRGRAGFVKILDFGLAKLAAADGPGAITGVGRTFGDPRYMAPEQAQGVTVDRRADIYALGLLGYEMLTGQPPFTGPDAYDVLRKQIELNPPPPSQLRPDIPKIIEATLLVALAKNPDIRPLTALRFVESLKGLAPSSPAVGPRVAGPRVAVADPPPEPGRVTPSLDAAMPTPGPGSMKRPTQSAIWFAEGDEMSRVPSVTFMDLGGTIPPASRPRRRTFVYVAAGLGSLVVTLGVGLLLRGTGAPEGPPAAPAAAAPSVAVPPPVAVVAPSPASDPAPAPSPEPEPAPAPVPASPVPRRAAPRGTRVPTVAAMAQADFHVKVGRNHLQKGDITRAVIEFRRAQSLDPENGEVAQALEEVAAMKKTATAPQPPPPPPQR